ncbi:MAG TPA: transglutaminase family protein [Terriglobia bacterium]|nr:transglutaminase family protein [Terriglobia bacterium]
MKSVLFDVIHITRYWYEAPVSQCLNEVRLTPRALPAQRVQSSEITVDPKPAFFHSRKDYFGNDVSVFGVLEKHGQLTATAHSVVDVRSGAPRNVPSHTAIHVRDMLAAESDAELMEAAQFRFQSPYVPAVDGLAAYAREIFPSDRPLIDAVKELTRRIHAEFKYDPKATSIDTPLSEVFRSRSGVCQDFAHVMIGALRSMRLAARYVSGYVRSGGKYQGAQASHAWVSVYFPGAGWIDFDPTNNLIPEESHVTVAWGRDYGDVTPIKGVTLGGGGQTVDVEVYVRPV